MSEARRLSDRTLADVPASVTVPRYDRAAVRPGIVHLGLGAFHRAHQAMFVDDCLNAGDTGWGIVGASLRSPDTRDALAPQDGLYTLSSVDGSGERLRVVGSIQRVLVAPEDPGALLAAMTDPGIRIVTLTVTEKAYLRNAAGELDALHPDIVWDLANPATPRTAHGFLAEAIARRRAAGTPPFTVLSCDNLPANGATLRRLLVAFCRLRDPDLGLFVEAAIAFPSSMVDRIVPATTDADRERIGMALGVTDAWPVTTEPFVQWVIEDKFPTGRPQWENFGVEMVADVGPFEDMKLRLLNGSHSGIAYLGVLSGHQTVAESFGDPAIRRFVQRLWNEAIPTLASDAGLRPWAYTEDLTKRFDNPALKHRTAQIANDGSQKLPQRIIATALERAEAAPETVVPRDEYRETITRTHTQDYTHKRLFKDVGQFARVAIRFEPNPEGEDFVFETRAISGLPEAYLVAVERGIRTLLESGPFAGFPIIGLKATLVDAAWHDTDSSPRAFEIAARACFHTATPDLGFKLVPVGRGADQRAEWPGRISSFDNLMLVPAAWIAACEARGMILPAGLFTDPLDKELARIFSDAPGPADTVRRVFDVAGFAAGDALRDRLIDCVAGHLEALRAGGAAAVLGRLRGSET